MFSGLSAISEDCVARCLLGNRSPRDGQERDGEGSDEGSVKSTMDLSGMILHYNICDKPTCYDLLAWTFGRAKVTAKVAVWRLVTRNIEKTLRDGHVVCSMHSTYVHQ